MLVEDMIRFVCIGECMVELSAAGEGLLARRFAGDAYNTAVYFKRALPAAEVQFLTAVGADPLSLAMRGAWRAEGIEGDLAFTVPGRRPALYLIETDLKGERQFHYWRGESAAKAWFAMLNAAGGAALLAGANLIYLSGISLAILSPQERSAALDLLHEVYDQGGRIAFDPNLRLALWPSIDAARQVFERMVGLTDILLPSRQDLQALYGVGDSREQMRLLTEMGAREVALTSDADDALIFDGALHVLTPPRAQVVDTSGGGDSFNGAYLAARLSGADAPEAARRGLELAARVVEQPGALIPPP
jgi:2-dehydro-3-deoxygluconokinase